MNTKSGNTQKLVVHGLLAAVAFAAVALSRLFPPVVLFLKFDPKDVILVIGGFLYGPLSACILSVVVSLIELFTISDTGLWGLLMNVLSSCAFACVASFLYKKRRKLSGAVIGLILGVLVMTAVMLLWNYLITPLYMAASREAVAAMLLPVFLPFNLLKGGLNAALTILLYRPLSSALRHARLLPETPVQQNRHTHVGVLVISLLVLASGVLAILAFQGVI
jgi:riboflavin transporter FmnP